MLTTSKYGVVKDDISYQVITDNTVVGYKVYDARTRKYKGLLCKDVLVSVSEEDLVISG